MKVIRLWETDEEWTFARLGEALADLGHQPQHVLHVGAHQGQEMPFYRETGASRITLVEPTPEAAAYLRASFPDVTVIEAACGTHVGRATLTICEHGTSNTLRAEIGDAPRAIGAVEVDVVTIASIQGDADVLVVDTQGTEADALASADLASPALRVVVVETQNTGLPEAAHIDDVNAVMAAHGWEPVLSWEHEWPGSPQYGYADTFYTRRPPTWTILVPTLGQRRDLLARLLDGLLPQVESYGGRVKVLAYWDCGEASIAEKRQALVEACDTDYLSFVDDDDTVSEDYVSAVVEALETRPDYVGLKMMVYRDGHEYGLSHHSLQHGAWRDTPEMFLRDITTSNPMRTDIARTADFRVAGPHSPEDKLWVDQLRDGGLLRTEVFVDRVLYHYWWETRGSAWGPNRGRVERLDPSERPWVPLAVDSPHFTYHPDSPIGDIDG